MKNSVKKVATRNPLRVLGLCVYPESAASTRLRLSYLSPAVLSLGGVLNIRPFLSEKSYALWSKRGLWLGISAIMSLGTLIRTLITLPHYNVIIIQRESLPFNILMVERLAHFLSIPIVWDVDDAIWIDSRWSRWLRGSHAKSSWLAKNAQEVWAGNATIEKWALTEGAPFAHVIPTTAPIPAATLMKPQRGILAWVGTPSTGKYIEHLLWELRDSLKSWTIDIVGAEISQPPGLTVNQHKWSPESEKRILSKAWIGLYPMDALDNYVHGKSALKAVLYGSYGIPTIATKTEATSAVVVQGKTGFLCQTIDDWSWALRVLKADEDRFQVGREAYNRVSTKYNPDFWANLVASRLERIVSENEAISN